MVDDHGKGPVMGSLDVFLWWRHQMEPFSALLALCAGNSPVPVNSPHKGQWRGALMFSLICAWINDWVNNREAGDLRRYTGHYDVNVMSLMPAWTSRSINSRIAGDLRCHHAHARSVRYHCKPRIAIMPIVTFGTTCYHYDTERSRGNLNIKALPCQSRNSNYKDKTVSWPFYHYNENFHTRKYLLSIDTMLWCKIILTGIAVKTIRNKHCASWIVLPSCSGICGSLCVSTPITTLKRTVSIPVFKYWNSPDIKQFDNNWWQATGLDARASRVKWPAQFMSHWYGILFIEWW